MGVLAHHVKNFISKPMLNQHDTFVYEAVNVFSAAQPEAIQELLPHPSPAHFPPESLSSRYQTVTTNPVSEITPELTAQIETTLQSHEISDFQLKSSTKDFPTSPCSNPQIDTIKNLVQKHFVKLSTPASPPKKRKKADAEKTPRKKKKPNTPPSKKYDLRKKPTVTTEEVEVESSSEDEAL